MRDARHNIGAFSLPELMIVVVICAIVGLMAMMTWEMCARETARAATTSSVSKETFGLLDRINQDVLRAKSVQVPDPDHADMVSMQVSVPVGSSTIRRAFRLDGNSLIVDLKDEGVAPYAAFENVTGLTFTVLDPPNNAQVLIHCTCTVNGRAFTAQTVAYRRN